MPMRIRESSPDRDYDVTSFNDDTRQVIVGIMGDHEYVERLVHPWELVEIVIKSLDLPESVRTALAGRLNKLQQEVEREQSKHTDQGAGTEG